MTLPSESLSTLKEEVLGIPQGKYPNLLNKSIDTVRSIIL
jgi:hypothetical protein